MGIHWLLCLAGVLSTFEAYADDSAVYRWKDAAGRTSYGNMPPPGVRAERVEASGRINVVPAPETAQPAVMPAAPADTAARLERLERELEAERALRLQAEAEAEDRERDRVRLKAECESKYREPCDDDGQPAGKRYIVVPARPHYRPPLMQVLPRHTERPSRDDRVRPPKSAASEPDGRERAANPRPRRAGDGRPTTDERLSRP